MSLSDDITNGISSVIGAVGSVLGGGVRGALLFGAIAVAGLAIAGAVAPVGAAFTAGAITAHAVGAIGSGMWAGVAGGMAVLKGAMLAGAALIGVGSIIPGVSEGFGMMKSILTPRSSPSISVAREPVIDMGPTPSQTTIVQQPPPMQTTVMPAAAMPENYLYRENGGTRAAQAGDAQVASRTVA